ncbi:hypothetical protein ACA910_013023 [Epithemia clementina (nom. ined.)]
MNLLLVLFLLCLIVASTRGAEAAFSLSTRSAATTPTKTTTALTRLGLVPSQTWSKDSLSRNNNRGRPSCDVRRITSPQAKPSLFTTTRQSRRALSASSLVLLDSTVAMASLSATLKLLCSIGLGVWASRKRIQNGTKKKGDTTTILDASAISALSRLTYWIFQPAFLFCSVTRTFAMAAATAAERTLSSSTLASSLSLTGSQLAVMPLAAMFQIGVGAIVGNFISSSSRKKNAKNATTTLLTANSDRETDSIVRMCTTFANSGPLPLLFADALFAKNAPAIQTQVVACISFYLLAWSPLFWSFGRLMLGTSETSKLIGQAKPNVFNRLVQQVQSFLSPPVVGMLFGMLVGANTGLRNFFLNGLAYPLYSAIYTIGTAYLPAALLVLAGSVASQKKTTNKSSTSTAMYNDDANKNNKEQSSSEAATPTRTSETSLRRSISTIAMARFILAPCWSLACVWGLNRFHLLGAAGTPARAILSFVILMEGCMPPAQNSVIMLQLVGLTGAASSMAQTLTILYGLAIVPVTLLLSGCLSISGIAQFL